MKRIFIVIAAVLAVAFSAVPARATTFPGLTLIYVVSGVTDSPFVATAVHCTNNSGQTATVRWRFFASGGAAVGTVTGPLTHSTTATVSTRDTGVFTDTSAFTGNIDQGMVAVYSTQSGVFCSAMILDRVESVPVGIDLHMVRFNAHPGTVE